MKLCLDYQSSPTVVNQSSSPTFLPSLPSPSITLPFPFLPLHKHKLIHKTQNKKNTSNAKPSTPTTSSSPENVFGNWGGREGRGMVLRGGGLRKSGRLLLFLRGKLCFCLVGRGRGGLGGDEEVPPSLCLYLWRVMMTMMKWKKNDEGDI